jgi:hypothetical protein
MKDLMDRTIDELKAKAAENGQHPRTLIVATAQAAIGAAIAQIEQKYDLTPYELVKCLAEYLSLSMKYALRVERHGDPEYPADAAPATRRRKAVKS